MLDTGLDAKVMVNISKLCCQVVWSNLITNIMISLYIGLLGNKTTTIFPVKFPFYQIKGQKLFKLYFVISFRTYQSNKKNLTVTIRCNLHLTQRPRYYEINVMCRAVAKLIQHLDISRGFQGVSHNRWTAYNPTKVY